MEGGRAECNWMPLSWKEIQDIGFWCFFLQKQCESLFRGSLSQQRGSFNYQAYQSNPDNTPGLPFHPLAPRPKNIHKSDLISAAYTLFYIPRNSQLILKIPWVKTISPTYLNRFRRRATRSGRRNQNNAMHGQRERERELGAFFLVSGIVYW